MNHPVPTEICDITDALSLWQRLVSGAIGRPLLPAVAVDAFRRLHRGGERVPSTPPCCYAQTGDGMA